MRRGRPRPGVRDRSRPPRRAGCPRGSLSTVLRRADDAHGMPWLKLRFRRVTGWVPLERTKAPPKPGCRSRSTGRASNGGLVCGKLLQPWSTLWVTRDPTDGRQPSPAKRRWGSDTTLSTIETVSAAYWRRFPNAPRLVIGDLSLRHGGPFGIHASHQQGLDIDIWYPRRGGEAGERPVATPRGSGRSTADVRSGSSSGLPPRERKLSTWGPERDCAGHGGTSSIWATATRRTSTCGSSTALDLVGRSSSPQEARYCARDVGTEP